jgi:hypothetical protein
MRGRVAGVTLAGLGIVALAGCHVPGTSSSAATTTTTTSAHTATSAVTYNPLTGPSEPAKSLPGTCDGVLTGAQIETVLGQMPTYASYLTAAPLPSIGRTGRVTCVYGLAPSAAGATTTTATGKAASPSPSSTLIGAVLQISVITYKDAQTALSRDTATVTSDATAGYATQRTDVGGHPATFIVETSATVLTMADGNRTFLVTLGKSVSAAVTARGQLLLLAADLYQNTLPAGTASSSK